MEQDFCSKNIIHDDIICSVAGQMPDDQTLYDLSEIFKMLGDTTRIKILTALSMHEMCGCDLAALLGISPSAVSHQMRLLRQARLVRFRKDGKVVYYALSDDHVEKIFSQGLEHVKE